MSVSNINPSYSDIRKSVRSLIDDNYKLVALIVVCIVSAVLGIGAITLLSPILPVQLAPLYRPYCTFPMMIAGCFIGQVLARIVATQKINQLFGR